MDTIFGRMNRENTGDLALQFNDNDKSVEDELTDAITQLGIEHQRAEYWQWRAKILLTLCKRAHRGIMRLNAGKVVELRQLEVDLYNAIKKIQDEVGK